ncbi:hypothetical protein BJ742DRAFT_834399 [Cladochytrium replicatum]|nr:hypothetical protein BJ742DRAFT_834399 [Cladochytrium replicatum]
MEEIQLMPVGLRSRLLVFMNDLQRYGDSKPSRDRLSTAAHQFYLTDCHFNPAEIDWILSYRTNEGVTFQEYAAQTLAGKTTLCTSHDLFPVFAEVFDVSKAVFRGAHFKAMLKEYEKVFKAGGRLWET